MFELMDAYSQSAVIKVIGVGGGGGNAVKHMASSGIEGVDFICANTDRQALLNANVKTTLQIGCNITRDLVPVQTLMLAIRPQWKIVIVCRS